MLTDGAIVIINKETGEVVAELQNPALVDKLNTDKYKAIPILEHLQNLNKGEAIQTIKEITTTLAKIREHRLCKPGWVKLQKSLGGIKSYGLHTPVKFSQIAESNGLDDAVWCLRSICPEHEKEVRLFAADCAESVLHLYEKEHDDTRPRDAVQAARDFANGLIDGGLRAAAWAAGDAAGDAACSAAARIAARVAARAAARDAARAAACAAAWYAAARIAGVAARDVRDVRDAQVKMLIKRFG